MINYELKDLQLLASGYTADVFTINQDLVLKLYYDGWNTNYVENEYCVGKAIEAYGISAPKVYDIITCANRSGIIFQRLNNVTMKDMLLKKPQNWQFYSKRMAQEHYHINSIRDDQNCLKDQKDVYEDLISTRKSIDEECKAKLIAKLRAMPDMDRICHGDFHPINLLFEQDSLYVIDWIGALRGNPLADVTGSYLIMKVMGATAVKQKHAFTNKLNAVLVQNFTERYLEEYLSISKQTRQDINTWMSIRSATYLDMGLPEAANEQLKEILMTYLNA